MSIDFDDDCETATGFYTGLFSYIAEGPPSVFTTVRSVDEITMNYVQSDDGFVISTVDWFETDF